MKSTAGCCTSPPPAPGPSGALLREVARLYSRAQRVVADCCRTTSTQCHLLTELERSGPQSMGDLGQRLYLEKSWVSRAVDSLLKAGLVEKSTNPLDARSWIVALTPAGHRTVTELNRTLDEHAEQLLGHLPAAQQVLIQQSLASLLQALRDDTAATCCLPVSNVSNPKP